MGRVSRNGEQPIKNREIYVAPRMGRVSRNEKHFTSSGDSIVAPRMGRVSRNGDLAEAISPIVTSRPAWGV